MKILIFLTAFSAVFLNRFGINVVSDFSLSLSYVFLYVTVFFALKKRLLVINLGASFLFLLTALSACISYLNGQDFRSLPSLFLFLFVYFPFVFEKRIKDNSDQAFFRLFYPMFLFVAVAGVCQFFLQFFYKPDWLFDYRPLIPDFLRFKNPMNTVIPIFSFTKSNGFFLLEPSGFSQMMALGMYLCIIFPITFFSYYLFSIGLLLSFSGTGLILFFFSSILGLKFSTAHRRYIPLLFLIFFTIISFLNEDSLLLTRMGEFSGGTELETSSAAARFKNPIITLKEYLFDSPGSFIFGQGPGTITRVPKDYMAHDPAWAKLLFEYGFGGGLFFLCFILFSVAKENSRRDLSFLFFIQWFFLGGHLLSLDLIAVYITYYKFSGCE
jgi:hypothetical protein